MQFCLQTVKKPHVVNIDYLLLVWKKQLWFTFLSLAMATSYSKIIHGSGQDIAGKQKITI